MRSVRMRNPQDRQQAAYEGRNEIDDLLGWHAAHLLSNVPNSSQRLLHEGCEC